MPSQAGPKASEGGEHCLLENLTDIGLFLYAVVMVLRKKKL